jgi:hypothetical protein
MVLLVNLLFPRVTPTPHQMVGSITGANPCCVVHTVKGAVNSQTGTRAACVGNARAASSNAKEITMTFYEYYLQKLIANGMFEDQAQAVMQQVMIDPANEAMLGRWWESTEGYLPVLLVILWFNVKTNALEWIDTNLPLAWYRPMFE